MTVTGESCHGYIKRLNKSHFPPFSHLMYNKVKHIHMKKRKLIDLENDLVFLINFC